MTRIVFILTSICLMVSTKINEFDCGEKNMSVSSRTINRDFGWGNVFT